MGHVVNLMFSFLKQKKSINFKRMKISYFFSWGEIIKKKRNWFIWTHTCILGFVVSIFSILLSKNKMHWCHTYCCLLRSHCLVSSRIAIYSPLERECLAWRDQIMVAKGSNHYTYQMGPKFLFNVILCAQPPDSMTSFTRKQYPNTVIGARYPSAVIWLVGDIYPNVTIWLVWDTNHYAAI